MRRRFIALAAVLGCACLALDAAPPRDRVPANAADFDTLWRAIDQGYAHDADSRRAWRRARDAARAKALKADSTESLALVLQETVAALTDDRVALTPRAEDAPRRLPAEADIWAEWRGDAAYVTAVRASSEADVAGLHPGHVITRIEGRPVDAVVRERLRVLGANGPRARAWALRHVLAGPRTGTMRLTVREGGQHRLVTIERQRPIPANGPPILARRIGDERDIGYLRIRNTLGDRRLLAAFDAALEYLKDTRALVLDLRETMDGGSPEATDAIADRFEGANASTRRAPLVVLVDRWTAAEGESLAERLRDNARATLVGTVTAGLAGRMREATLANSGITVRFPVEPARAVRPSIAIDLAAPSGGPGDPILYQALKLAERR